MHRRRRSLRELPRRSFLAGLLGGASIPALARGNVLLLTTSGGAAPSGVWSVSGVSTPVTTLAQLGALLVANPSASVTQLKSYDATVEGTFATPPLAVGGSGFQGSYNGAGYTLTYDYTEPTGDVQLNGLFDKIGVLGVVENLTVAGTVQLTYVSGSTILGQQVGGLAAVNNGVVQSCGFTGTVSCASSGAQVGGLIGKNQSSGQVLDCTGNNNTSVGSVAQNCYLSNLVSYNIGLINGCSVTSGSLVSNISTGAWQGPICGANGATSGTYSTAIIENCYATISVTGGTSINAANYVGGLVGDNLSGQIIGCYATGGVSGASFVGGLVGNGETTDNSITTSYATGAVSGTGTYVGGLVGETSGVISQCWASGAASATEYVGGLVGELTSTAQVDHVWASGSATGSGTGRVGGLFGAAVAGSTITQGLSFGAPSGGAAGGSVGLGGCTSASDLYWCENSAGTATGVGSGAFTAAPTGLTSTALAASMPSGFDGDWSQSAEICGGFPVLANVTTPPTPSVPAVKSVALVGVVTNAGSATISMPAGIQSGDLAVLFDLAQNTSTTQPTAVTPTGFTNESSNAAGATYGVRSMSSYKVLTGSETTITGMATGTRDTLKVLVVFRGFNGSGWTIASARSNLNSSDTGVATSTAMNGESTPCVALCRAISDGGSFSSPMISLGDDAVYDQAGAILSAAFSYHVENTSAAQCTVTGDTSKGVATTGLWANYS